MSIGMDDRRAPYVVVADALRADIRRGQYAAGDRLPTVAELAAQHGVAKMTVQKGIDVLREEGYVISWQGRGTFVRSNSPTDELADTDATQTHEALTRRLDEMQAKIEQLTSDRAGRPSVPDVDGNAEQIKHELEGLRRQVGRLEALIIDLYSRSGQPFPHERGNEGMSAKRAAG